MTSYYDETEATPAEAEDQRITLVQRIVDMERAHRSMEMEQKRLAEKGSALYRELQQARNELGSLLGFHEADYAAKVERVTR